MNITVCDLDSVCYRAAAASQTTSINATHKPTGKSKVFKNKTELKELLKSKGKLDKLSDYSIEEQAVAEPLENCLYTVKRQIEKIKEATKADQLVCVVGGKDNFRDRLELPKQYKGNRIDMLRPLHLTASKEYVMLHFNAEEINGEESDDAIIYKAYELKSAGHNVIVSSIDKDSLQADGLTLYDFSTDTTTVTEGHWFDLIGETNGTKKATGSGVGFLCFQVLTGDSTDFYKPTDLIPNIKYGQASFHKDTRHCKSPQDYLEVVKQRYQLWYPEPINYTAWNKEVYTKDWKQLLDLYFRCAYMKRTKNDKSCSKEFFGKYGVEL